MRRITEILRLRWELKWGYRRIARALGVSHSSVMDLVERAERAKLKWPFPPELDEDRLEELLYPNLATPKLSQRPVPDWAYIHKELRRRDVHMTLRLLWREYKDQHPDGLQYSQFCELYRQFAKDMDVTMRQVYRGGEKLFVDFAGDTVPVFDPKTGEVRLAQIFVAVLGASGYTFATAFWAQDLPCWIEGHILAFEFFAGVPEIVVPDNLKAGVTKASYYEPEVNPTYQELAEHYGTVIIPARPRKSTDKAKVERGVLLVEQQILARLRNHSFFNLHELRQGIQELLPEINERPFQKLDGSRRSLYEELDKPALKPLPPTRYTFAEWRKAKVNIDYHIEVDYAFYSVPYQLVGVREPLDVRLTAHTVEVFRKGKRVASHTRLSRKGGYSTQREHMPAAHRAHAEWTPSRVVNWGRKVGDSTGKLVTAILASKPHPEQGYRACLGLIRLERRYGGERLEAACARALSCQAFSYRSVKSILDTGLDRVPVEESHAELPPHHENVRGPEYYADQEGDLC